MSKNLVIVESPAKIKTIKKFLGSNYNVVASVGHVRDLPKSRLGVDVDNDFEPQYITIRGKGEVLKKLRANVKASDKVYLATDPDREGEAISWHLTYALKLDMDKTYRISFNEITKDAVKESIKNAREIDIDLVNAQQARRVLDRIVGYSISPLLWAKVKRGLSAGRVQSVALNLIAKREKEISEFIPEEYWSLDVSLANNDFKQKLNAKFYGSLDEKIELKNEKETNDIIDYIKDKDFVVTNIKVGTRKNKSPLPFTTSTMQQEASKELNFATSKTMRIAQQLYEGVNIKGEGVVALITYLRTDSTRISDTAKEAANKYIVDTFGKENAKNYTQSKSNSGKIQDAHEAIRPTDVWRTPTQVKESLSRDQFRLYNLIWKRFVASQMSDCEYETKSVNIDCNKYRFKASTSQIKFMGFKNVYTTKSDDKNEKNPLIDKLEENMTFKLSESIPEQHFTQGPSHFTEASLVKMLEELGIGRPSTYAPTIGTLLARRYIAKESRNIFITEIGEVVNGIMETTFPEIVDVAFTANMEKELDMVADSKMEWKEVIRQYYPKLNEEIKKAEKDLEQITIEDEVSDVICEKCGRNMVVKYGPYGKFLACPGFPDCRNTKPFFEKAGVKCPKCGKEVVIMRTKKGRLYYGCEGYPDCDFISWNKPVDEKCPKCGSYMVEKGKKIICSNETCGYVKETSQE